LTLDADASAQLQDTPCSHAVQVQAAHCSSNQGHHADMIECKTAGNDIMLILQRVQSRIRALQAKLGSRLLEPKHFAWKVISCQQFGNTADSSQDSTSKDVAEVKGYCNTTDCRQTPPTLDRTAQAGG